MFEPNSSSEEELDELVTSAEMIINKLMDIIQEMQPELYSRSNVIMCADDWLKWKNGEAMNNEVRDIIKEIEDYCA